jgi:hypothetical protein
MATFKEVSLTYDSSIFVVFFNLNLNKDDLEPWDQLPVIVVFLLNTMCVNKGG